MSLQADSLYHFYNQGNRKQKIFFSDSDYLEFLTLTQKFVFPNADILAYCLMPNHFHFLLNINPKSVQEKKQGSLKVTNISNGFRLLQSSYANYVNKQQNQVGSLFKQKVQFKLLENVSKSDYPFTCFNYIHYNPKAANLVSSLFDWEYSSLLDIIGKRNGTLINFELIKSFFDFEPYEYYDLLCNQYFDLKFDSPF